MRRSRGRAGEYYAVIVIPSDSSQRCSLLFDGVPLRADDLLRQREEERRLPKIAGQGAERRVSAQVNQTAQTLRVLDTATSAGGALSPTAVITVTALDKPRADCRFAPAHGGVTKWTPTRARGPATLIDSTSTLVDLARSEGSAQSADSSARPAR